MRVEVHVDVDVAVEEVDEVVEVGKGLGWVGGGGGGHGGEGEGEGDRLPLKQRLDHLGQRGVLTLDILRRVGERLAHEPAGLLTAEEPGSRREVPPYMPSLGLPSISPRSPLDLYAISPI